MPFVLFLILSAIALAGGVTMVLHKNPVTSALALAVSFLAVAGLFIQLDAELMGIFQILVYAGAIMVLFLFIIMLLDVKSEDRGEIGLLGGLGAIVLGGLFLLQFGAVLFSFEDGREPLAELDPLAALEARVEAEATALPNTNAALKRGELPDAHLLGEALFGRYLLPLQVIAILLLVASVGVVVLSRRQQAAPAGEEETSPETAPES